MSDATLYRLAGGQGDDQLVATIEAVTVYDMTRPLLGTIHEPPASHDPGIHRQALPFGSRTGTLELALIGDDAEARAIACDAALRMNALYRLECPHFVPLDGMRWAVAGDYRLTYRPERGRRVWLLSLPVKEVV